MSLTLDDPALIFWRMQPANKHLTDQSVITAIESATNYANDHARSNATEGARDAIALFRLRWMFADDPSDRRMLMDAAEMLMGGCRS